MSAIVHCFLEDSLVIDQEHLEDFDLIGHHPTSVKHFSPFRYPGGKSWLSPQIHEWLSYLDCESISEPFAGGASVSLYALMDGLVDFIHINEIDPNIYNFWHVLKYNHLALISRIEDFGADEEIARKTVERFKRDSNYAAGDPNWAFLTLLRNRLSRNGVMTNKSGVLNKGDRGLFSRWYPDTLIYRIKKIAEFANAIKITNVDGISLIKPKIGQAVFIDPPYTRAGKHLYNFNEVDHSEIIKSLANVKSFGLATYDAHLHIAGLIKRNDLCYSRIAMMSGMNRKKIELLISSDLSWLGG